MVMKPTLFLEKKFSLLTMVFFFYGPHATQYDDMHPYVELLALQSSFTQIDDDFIKRMLEHTEQPPDHWNNHSLQSPSENR